jgi:dolichol-phosphate mannosyltransferase
LPAVEPRQPAISIVVPTYDERDRLEALVSAVLRAFAAEHIDAEIIIVDDNSPDGTGALADELAARLPVRVLHRAEKLGLGTAVIDGFNAARATIVGVIDADLSHPPELLPRMLAVMRRTSADMVIGSRYVPGGGTQSWKSGRLLLSRLACFMARLLTPVKDGTSGCFLIRRGLARDVVIRAGGFKICLELLMRGRPATVVEVPYVFHGRTVGKSKMNLTEAVGYIVQLRQLRQFTRSQPRLWQQYSVMRVAEPHGTPLVREPVESRRIIGD